MFMEKKVKATQEQDKQIAYDFISQIIIYQFAVYSSRNFKKQLFEV